MSAVPESDRELESLLETARTKTREIAEQGAIAKLSYSHDAMIDLIIANPGISQNEIARRFGYTASWISQVISSDAFQTALAKRREQIVDPVLAAEVGTQFKSLVSRSLDILHQKLNRPALEIPDNLALRALEISSRAAGYGAKDANAQPAATPVEVNIHLEQLGGGLVQLLQRKKLEAGVIEGSRSPTVDDGFDSKLSVAAQQIVQLTNDSSSSGD